MSKIDNHIVGEGDSHTQSNQVMKPEAQENEPSKKEQKDVCLDDCGHKSNQLTSHQGWQVKKQLRAQCDQDLNFSRFSCWGIIEMIGNLKVRRQTEENQQTAENNLQQLNQKESLDDQYDFFTPLNPDSLGSSQKKQGLTSEVYQKVLLNQLYEKRLRPKQKGLRRLSRKAFQIVRDMESVTYKQVALRLIHQIQKEQSQMGQQKQQNNIKRRVYDALNVLIAMGILSKKGRNIVYQSGSKMAQQQKFNLQFKQRKNTLLEQLKTIAEKVRKKKQDLKKTQTKITALKKLMNRNKIFTMLHIEKIQFPFVCLMLTSNSLDSISLSQDKNNFEIVTRDQYSFFGDLDFLLRHPSLMLD